MLRICFIFIALIGLLLRGNITRATETITWFQPDFPPYVILEEPDKRLGIDNRVVQFMVDQLPDYEHFYKPSNYKRILKNLEDGKSGIVTPLFRTPQREKFVHYTEIPSYLVFSNGFIYSKADKEKYDPYIQDDGTLDLQALCNSGQFTIAINSGRAYYGILDKIIQQKRNEKTFYTRSTLDHLGILKMVLNKRVDAALGFPVEIKYAGYDQKLSFFHVSEMTTITPVFFGLPKSKFGIQVTNRLNSVLSKKENLDQFAQYYMYWLSEDLKPEYEQIRQAYYQKLTGTDIYKKQD
jgi:uncharacterized protein (TIGR02285 family)